MTGRKWDTPYWQKEVAELVAQASEPPEVNKRIFPPMTFAAVRVRDGVEQEIARFATERGRDNFMDRIEAAAQTLRDHQDLLADEPHPTLPPCNLTARDYVIWCLDNATQNGLLLQFRGNISPNLKWRNISRYMKEVHAK